MSDPTRALDYLDAIETLVRRIRTTQLEPIERAASVCADSIAAGGLVHLFGTGHSRIPVEEVFPRHGSFPSFHPSMELLLTFHTQVVGANGQRHAMFLERIEGLGEVILRNFVFGPRDPVSGWCMAMPLPGTRRLGATVPSAHRDDRP